MTRENLKKFLWLAVPIFLTMAPVIVGGRVFAGGDVLGLHLPNLQFYHEALAQGKSFFWNPYVLSGFPVFASLVGGLLSPLNLLLFKFLPVATAHPWAIFLNLVLTAWFTALFLKRLGLSFWAQILGGLTFVFSQWFIVTDLGIVNSFPVLPLVFLLLWEAREKTWPIFAGSALLGYMWLAAHYNWILMILLGSALFAAFLGKKVFGKFILMNIVGLSIGFWQLFPALVYSQFSARILGVSLSEASSGAVGIFDLPRLFLANFRLPFVNNAEALLYIGVVPLFFSLVGIFVKNKLARFFTVTAALAILLSVKYSPLFWVLHKLPVLSGFRGPSRWMFIGSFALSALAGFGLDYLGAGAAIKNWLRKTFQILGYACFAGGVLAAAILPLFGKRLLSFLDGYFAKNLYHNTSGLPLAHYQQVIADLISQTRALFSWQNPQAVSSYLFLLLSLLFLAWYWKKRSDPELKQKLQKQAVVLVAINFIAVFIGFHPTLSKALWQRPSRSAQIIQKSPGKVLALMPGFSEWEKLTVPYGYDPAKTYLFQKQLMTPDLNMLDHLPAADGYENLMPRRMARLLALLGSDRATTGEKLVDQKIPPEEKVKLFESRSYLLDKLGIKYVLSVYPLAGGDFQSQGMVATPDYQIPVYIYENPNAKPLMYFADKVLTLPPDEAAVYQAVFDPKNAPSTILECQICPTVLGGSGAIKVTKQENNLLEATVRTGAPGLLVFQESNLPGWIATIDGKPVSVYTIDSVFMGIFVPAGSHEILFQYSYKSIFQDLKTFAKLPL